MKKLSIGVQTDPTLDEVHRLMKRQVRGLTAEGENIFNVKPLSSIGPGADMAAIDGRQRPFMKSLGDYPSSPLIYYPLDDLPVSTNHSPSSLSHYSYACTPRAPSRDCSR